VAGEEVLAAWTAGVSRRARAASRGSLAARSNDRQSRMTSAVAASTSIAMSASTARIIG